MEWIRKYFSNLSRWGYIVCQATNWYTLSSHFKFLPISEKINEEITSEFLGKHLRNKEKVGDKSTLKNNWNI